MNKLLTIFFFTLIQTVVSSQNQPSNWYFGEEAGLNFSQDSVIALSDGQTSVNEGTSTISDSCGNLLFYTDGNTVWNKIHDTLSNGQNLNGYGTSSQSSIIIPKPSSDNLFYVFTVDYQGGTNGLNHSLLNMNLSNGLGKITVKNIPLVTPICEKITAVYHENGIDVWVVVHHYGSNAFYSYLVTNTGIISTPVISFSGSVIALDPMGNNTMGCMKISPNGKKLAIANRYSSELFDFNDSTGVVSNSLILENNTIYNYGVEFSPSSEVLYMCGGGIYQYDLNASNIPASRYTVHPFYGSYALQLGSNRKIYSAENGSSFINVINKPNILGVNCDLQIGTIDLNGRKSKLGLPNFIQSYFKPNFTVINLCFNDSAIFNLYGIEYDSLLWNFGDPQSGLDSTSTTSSPKHIFSTPGSYEVSLTIYLNGNAEYLFNTINIYYINLGNDTVLCHGESITLEVNKPGKYLWNDGSRGNYQKVTSSGIYWIEYISNTCCVLNDTISVLFKEPIDVEISGNTEICTESTITLSIIDNTTQSFLWSNGTTDNFIQISNTGTYWVEVSDNGCKILKEIIINHCNAVLILPNVFSPNNDGVNDLFEPILSKGILGIKTLIYNRWGQLIFKSDTLNIGWNGRTISGSLAPEGTYYFSVKYLDTNKEEIPLKDFVTLLR
jgi:gliding motility-associated-like protein